MWLTKRGNKKAKNPDCWSLCLEKKGRKMDEPSQKWHHAFSISGNLPVITLLSSHPYSFWKKNHICHLSICCLWSPPFMEWASKGPMNGSGDGELSLRNRLLYDVVAERSANSQACGVRLLWCGNVSWERTKESVIVSEREVMAR